jgi:hypothetical protein
LVYEADLVANPAAESMVKPQDGLNGASNYRFVKEKYADLAYYSKQAHYNHVNEKELQKTPKSPMKGASLSMFIRKGQSDVMKKGSGSKSVCSATVDSTLDSSDTRSLCQFSTKKLDLTPKYNGSTASSLQSSCGSLDFRPRDRGDSGNFMEEANQSMLIKKPSIHNDPRRAAFHQSRGNLDFATAEGDDDDIPEDSNEIEQNMRLNTSSKDVKKSKKSTRISVLASKSIPSPRLPQNKRMGLYSVNQRGRSSSRTRDGQRDRSISRARDNPLDKADNGRSRSSARTLESGGDRLSKRRGRSNCARSIASSVDITKNRSQPGATDPVDSNAVSKRPTSTSGKNRLESSARRTPVSSARCRSSSRVRTRRSGDSTLSGSSASLDVSSIAHEVSKKPSARGSSRSSSKIRSRRSEDHGLNGSSARLDAAGPRSTLGRSSSTSRLNSRNLDNTNESSASPSSLATNARRRRSPSRKTNRSTPLADSSGSPQDREAKKDALPHDDQDAKLQRRSRSSSRDAVGRRPQSYSKSKGVTSGVSSEKKVGTRGNKNSQFRPKSTDRLNASSQSLSFNSSSQSLSLDSVFPKKNEGLSDYIPEDDGEMSFQVIPGSSNHQRSSFGANKIGSDKGSGSKSFTAPYISKSDLKPASEYENERRRSSRGKLAGINAKRVSRKSDIFASLDREEDEVNQQAGPLMRRQFRTQSVLGAGPLQVRAPPKRTSSDTSQFRGIVNTASKKTYNF